MLRMSPTFSRRSEEPLYFLLVKVHSRSPFSCIALKKKRRPLPLEHPVYNIILTASQLTLT
jgi:hypothetical protein